MSHNSETKRDRKELIMAETRKPLITQEYEEKFIKYVDEVIEDLKAISGNTIGSALYECIAQGKFATDLVKSTKYIVETEVLSLVDAMTMAFDETHGSISKLKRETEKASQEISFLSKETASLRVQKNEINGICESIEKLNKALNEFKRLVDDGTFEKATKCHSAMR